MGKIGLTDIEYELMSLFWGRREPATFSEILEYCNEEKGFNWAKTTAHTHLTRLVQKGLLSMGKRGAKRTYYAIVTREEQARVSAEEFVKDSFSGSLKEFLVSFAGNNALTREDIEELRRTLDEFSE